MICPRCRKPMREEKRSFHKKRKWICRYCGKVVMQRLKAERRKKKYPLP
jgi:hypothetical protein